jgi:hypothetical protein
VKTRVTSKPNTPHGKMNKTFSHIKDELFICHLCYLFNYLLISFFILGGSIHSIKKNAEYLVIASKKPGLEANAETTKYMVMS